MSLRTPRRLLSAAAAALVLTSTAVAYAAPGPLPLDPIDLKRQSLVAQADQLAAKLPARSVAQVLDDANRVAVPMTTPPPGASSFVRGFQFDSADTTDCRWWPQGVSTSGDASSSGTYYGRKVVLVSWHYTPAECDNTANQDLDVRISFVDLTDPSHPRYRHVLLVQPFVDAGGPNFRAVSGVHAGGIAWYGNLLYVASSRTADPNGGAGLRVFDLDKILEVPTGTGTGRQADGSYHADTYKYVVPQVLNYKTTQSDTDYPGFSWLYLDKTAAPDRIITGRYVPWSGSTSCPARMASWDLTNSRELSYDATSGNAQADWARETTVCGMQGGGAVGDTYYLLRTASPSGPSDLISWKPGIVTRVYPNALTQTSNDLSYDGTTGEMWTAVESSNARYRGVYSFRPSAFPAQ